MAIHATKKEILENWFCISVPYCDAQNVLRFAPHIASTSGIYGWNASCYLVDGLMVVTGYRPFGDIRADRDRLADYERRAEGASREDVESLCLEWVRAERADYLKKRYPDAY